MSEHEAINKIAEGTQETRAMLAAHVADFRVFKTKLLGDDEEESPMGRIPQLEAEVFRLKKRQAKITRLSWIASGVVLCLNVLGWLANIASHISGAIKR